MSSEASYKRVPRDPNQVLTNGLYEVVSTVKDGDATKLTSSQIQKMLNDSFGSRVELLWFSAKDNQKLQIQFKVDKPTGGPVARPEFLPWLALTAVAIFATIYTLYRIKTDDPQVFELIPQKIGTAIGNVVGSATNSVVQQNVAWLLPIVAIGFGILFFTRSRGAKTA